jgi:hypothetical protein
MGFVSMRKIFLEGNRRRFLRKESTRWRLRFRRMGSRSLGIGPDQEGYFYPSAGGEPRVVNGLEPGDVPIRWNQDGRSIYLYRTGECGPRFISWN